MFKKRFSLPVLMVSVILSALFTFQITFVTLREAYTQKLNQSQLSENEDAEKMALVAEMLRTYCIYEVDPDLPCDMALSAYLAASGDKWAYYYTAEEYAALLSSDDGNQSGIGITITDHANGLFVSSVVLSSPAEKAGLQAGDILTAVNGTLLAELSYDAKADLLLGKEGDRFLITLTRGDKTLSVSVTRAVYESPSVTGKMLPDNQTGLVRIESFNNDTDKLFREITASLAEQGADRFIYDLRGNPGGSLSSVVAVLDYLLPQGTVVTLENYDGTKDIYESDAEEFDYPAAILVNGGTASAGELFSACMRDYGAAVLVGETTYGKGVAQSIFTLPDGSAVKITTAKYYSPKTTNYDNVGLNPDIVVQTPENLTDFAHSNYDSDPQMQKAAEYLQDKK